MPSPPQASGQPVRPLLHFHAHSPSHRHQARSRAYGYRLRSTEAAPACPCPLSEQDWEFQSCKSRHSKQHWCPPPPAWPAWSVSFCREHWWGRASPTLHGLGGLSKPGTAGGEQGLMPTLGLPDLHHRCTKVALRNSSSCLSAACQGRHSAVLGWRPRVLHPAQGTWYPGGM